MPDEPDSADRVAARIDRDTVARVAELACLRLTADELDVYTDQLRSILDYARDIEELDLDDVEPTSHPYPLRNVLRADRIAPSLDRDEVLAQAPAAEDGMFRVPPVLGDAP